MGRKKMHKNWWFGSSVALAVGLSVGGCSKQSEPQEPTASASVQAGDTSASVEVETQEGPDRNLFEKAWDAVAEAGDDAQDVGEWTVEKAQDGAVVAWRKTKDVAHEVDDQTRDAALLTRVKARLAAAENADATDIDVNVKDGVVVLKGKVDSKQEAQAAVQAAAGTRGVERVVSYLSLG
jgi:BON domain